MTILDKIKMVPLPADQYYDESKTKTQIYLHHTASSPNPYSVMDWWKSTTERVGTSFIIAGHNSVDGDTKWKDGDITQTFGSGKWAHHLGLKQKHVSVGGSTAKTNTQLNQHSIGIEICNWGWVTKTSNGFVSYTKRIIPDNEIVELSEPYRGYKFYQKYTDAQLNNTHELLRFLCKKWNVSTEFKGTRIFNVCADAIQGSSGIWTHSSVRPDKFDCFPQKELLTMLSSI